MERAADLVLIFIRDLWLSNVAVPLLIKATLILAITQLVVMATPKASAATKHLILTLGMITVLALPFLSLMLPEWQVPLFPDASVTRPVSIAVEKTASFPAASSVVRRESPSLPEAAIAMLVSKVAGVELSAKTGGPETTSEDGGTPVPARRLPSHNTRPWSIVMIAIWMTGSLVLLGRLLVGTLRLFWVATQGTPLTTPSARLAVEAARGEVVLSGTPEVVTSNQVTVPMVWGIAQPVLLLPADAERWPAARLRVVILHELAHLKRWDGISLLASRVTTAIYWFHPLVWVLERSARRECERACDDLVLNSGALPSEYAGHLMSIAKSLPRRERFAAVTLAMSRRSHLEGRLLSILKQNVRRGELSLAGLGFAALAALFLTVPLATLDLAASPSKDTGSKAGIAGNRSEAPSTEINVVSNRLEEGKGKACDRDEAVSAAVAAVLSPGSELHKRFEAAVTEKDFKEAEKCLEKAVAAHVEALNLANITMAHLSQFRGLERFASSFVQVKNEGESRSRTRSGRRASNIDQLAELEQTGSTDGQLWYRTGSRLLTDGDLPRAIRALTRAAELLGSENDSALYNLACAHSIAGDTENALRFLDRSLDAGFGSPGKLHDDEDLDNIRSQPRFRELVAKAEALVLRNDSEDGDSESGWLKAAARSERYLKSHPDSGRAWFNLGFALHTAGDSARGIDAFSRALRLNHRQATTSYNIACGYAKLNQKDAAFDWLNRAEKAGFKLGHYIGHDDDLDNLRSDPRFIELKKRTRTADDHFEFHFKMNKGGTNGKEAQSDFF